MGINNFQTVIGLLNGMIGGSILVLPLQGIEVGYVSVIIITLFLSIICGYTAFLILKHLGKAKTINEAIEQHFQGDKRYSKAYNIFISTTFWPWCSAYFHLLTLQIKGLFGIQSWTLPLGIFVFMFVLTIFLKRFQLGEKVLAYGIISIVSYVIFLTWAQITAPSGPNTVTPFGSGYSNYSAILMGALAIHDFIVQVMIHNTQRRSYTRLIILTYILGCSAYMYMGFGSFAVINRVPIREDPEIIAQFFQPYEWQVHVIQVIYSIHLLTALPQFILISKVRMFQALGFEQVQKTIEIKEVIFIFSVLFVSYLLYILNLRISVILEVTGSLMSLFYVIIIPVAIHLKCLYYDKSAGYIEDDDEHNKQIVQNACECDLTYSSKQAKMVEVGWIIITVLVGLYVTVYTMYTIFFGKEKIQS